MYSRPVDELNTLHEPALEYYTYGNVQNFVRIVVSFIFNTDESCQYINYTVDHGSTIILPVNYSLRNETDKVEWSTDSFYGDITETANKGKYNLQQNGNLLIRQVDDDDNCIFQCKLNEETIYYSVTVENGVSYR